MLCVVNLVTGEVKFQLVGGVVFLVMVLVELCVKYFDFFVVVGGDLIGVLLLIFSLLCDEFMLVVMLQFDIVVSVLGNYELDVGLLELLCKVYGECGLIECLWFGFKGFGFFYFGVNVLDVVIGKLLLFIYVFKQVVGFKVVIVGVVMLDIFYVIVVWVIKGICFVDEVDMFNVLVFELKVEGVQVLVVVMYEGGV